MAPTNALNKKINVISPSSEVNTEAKQNKAPPPTSTHQLASKAKNSPQQKISMKDQIVIMGGGVYLKNSETGDDAAAAGNPVCTLRADKNAKSAQPYQKFSELNVVI